MHDSLYSYQQQNNPVLVNQFKLAMQIISTGLHHTGVHASISINSPNTNRATNALENITMKIVELNKIAHTDHLGTAQIERIQPGTYHLEFSGTGITTEIQAVTITRGHIAHTNILLQLAQN